MESGNVHPERLGAELAAMRDRGEGFEAVARCRDIMASHREDAPVLAVLLPTLVQECEAKLAAGVAGRLAELRAHDPQTLADLSNLCQKAGDLRGAEEAADRLLAVSRGNAMGIALRGEAMYLQGRYGEAFEYIAPLARAPNTHLLILLVFARLCVVEKKPWQAISPLEQALGAGRPYPRPALVEAMFALANLYSSAGRHDQAWAAVTRANELKGASFDPDRFDARIDAAIAAWTREAVAALPTAQGTITPIPIVGMPRSGTTLVEQILASHPAVAAGDELTMLSRLASAIAPDREGLPPIVTSPSALAPEVVARASRRYGDALAEVAGAEGRPVEHVTDKMPINALNLGLLQAIAPGARVLWVRRDPLDTAISCYFQHFGGANSYSYDLTHLGRFHRAMERLILHMRGVLSLEIMEVAYEEMVADLPGWTRSMLEFVGLPWDEACLRFYENRRAALTLSNAQVRKPVFTSSIGRWKAYEQHLGPLREALRASS